MLLAEVASVSTDPQIAEAWWQAALAPKFWILYILFGSALFIHFRGKKRHKFMRQLTDHSTFMAPYNALIYLASGVKNKPILDREEFPDLNKFKENWETIRDEALQLYEGGHLKKSEKYNDLAFNTFFKRGWTRFYLKWYGDVFPSGRELCPKTVELVESVPGINAALFTMLPAGSKLGEHRDPFAGSLRYHLGLSTPNSDDCVIYIDGEPHSWRDGEDVVFDETFIHSAHNKTEQKRLIFFCDVERPLRSPIMRWINRFTVKHIVKATQTQNTDAEKVGILNKISGLIYALKGFFKKLKRANKPVYTVVKYSFLIGLVYMIFFFPWDKVD